MIKLENVELQGFFSVQDSAPSTAQHEESENENENENCSENTSENLKSKNGERKCWDFFMGGFVFLLVISAFFFAYFMDNRLPTALTLEDLKDGHENSGKFIDERAMNDLLNLTRESPRVSGSAYTDVVTPLKLMDMLRQIKNQSQENEANSNLELELKWNLEFEVQKVSGHFEDSQKTILYDGVTNVVAKLEPREFESEFGPRRRSNNSILLSCHFDSAVGSPGATDDMASCAVMLEVIRVLSGEKVKAAGESQESPQELQEELENSFIFLFNSGEESLTHSMLGSRGFLKSGEGQNETLGHPWSKSVRAFINLEGVGGGRVFILRSTKSLCWLTEAYLKSAVSPFGVSFAGNIFQSIGFGTDFTNYQRFIEPPIPGIDLAFVKNGWIYHTELDSAEKVEAGSLTHMGENVLALLRYVSSANLSQTSVEKDCGTGLIYFDVFGLFQISYFASTGIFLHIFCVVIFIVIFVYEVVHTGQFSSFWKIASLITLILLSFLSCAATLFISGNFVASLLPFKPYFSYPSLAFVLYGIPGFFTPLLIISLAAFSKLESDPDSFPLVWLGTKLPVVFAAISTPFVNVDLVVSASFIFLIPVVFILAGWMALLLVRKSFFGHPWQRELEQLALLIFGELFPLFYTAYLLVVTLTVLIPFTAWDAFTNWNLYIGFLVGGGFFLIFHGLIPFLLLSLKKLHFTSFNFKCNWTWSQNMKNQLKQKFKFPWQLISKIDAKPLIFILFTSFLVILSMFAFNPIAMYFLGVDKLPFSELTPMRFEIQNQYKMKLSTNAEDLSSNPFPNGSTIWTVDKIQEAGYFVQSFESNVHNFLNKMKTRENCTVVENPEENEDFKLNLCEDFHCTPETFRSCRFSNAGNAENPNNRILKLDVLNSAQEISEGKKKGELTLSLAIVGPPIMTISYRINSNWDVVHAFVSGGIKLYSNKVQLQRGHQSAQFPFQLNLTLEIPRFRYWMSVSFDLTVDVKGTFLDHEISMEKDNDKDKETPPRFCKGCSEEYQNFLWKFPNWTTLEFYTTVEKSFVISAKDEY